MLCRKPFIAGDVAYGCGQCLPCRVKRRRIWVHRILLESMLYAESSFVTVTYSEEHLPLINGKSTLRRKDYSDWLKRLRWRMTSVVKDWKLRFFLVGEYGEESNRPHYHAMLFGYKGCIHGDARLVLGDRKECACASCNIIRDTWGKGRIHQGVIERKSAQYVAGYTLKKKGQFTDGREDEFARMSLRPGIGRGAVERIADVLKFYALVGPDQDVPSSLRIGQRILPLGRYMRQNLRKVSGVSEEEGKRLSYEEWKKELRALREAASALSDKQVYVEGTFDHEIFRRLLVEQDAEKVRQIESRRKLYERGKK